MTGSLHFFKIRLDARLLTFDAARASCLRISRSRNAVSGFQFRALKSGTVSGDRNAVIA
jgi:hypothetical protein